MSELWRSRISDVFSDLNAAYLSNEERALVHLRAARDQLNQMIEELEGD